MKAKNLPAKETGKQKRNKFVEKVEKEFATEDEIRSISFLPVFNLHENIEVIEDEENIELRDSEDECNGCSLYSTEINDASYYVRFIKSVESLIRQSQEYKDYIFLVRRVEDLNFCMFLSNIRTDEDDDITLEMHHYPLTLFDIVETVMNHKLNNNEKVSSFDLAHLVMKEHFQGNIGLVPLTKTMHTLTHAGNLEISLKQVYGKYWRFVSKYKDGIDKNIMDKLNVLMEKSKDDTLQLNDNLFKIERTHWLEQQTVLRLLNSGKLS